MVFSAEVFQNTFIILHIRRCVAFVRAATMQGPSNTENFTASEMTLIQAYVDSASINNKKPTIKGLLLVIPMKKSALYEKLSRMPRKDQWALLLEDLNLQKRWSAQEEKILLDNLRDTQGDTMKLHLKLPNFSPEQIYQKLNTMVKSKKGSKKLSTTLKTDEIQTFRQLMAFLTNDGMLEREVKEDEKFHQQQREEAIQAETDLRLLYDQSRKEEKQLRENMAANIEKKRELLKEKLQLLKDAEDNRQRRFIEREQQRNARNEKEEENITNSTKQLAQIIDVQVGLEDISLQRNEIREEKYSQSVETERKRRVNALERLQSAEKVAYELSSAKKRRIAREFSPIKGTRLDFSDKKIGEPTIGIDSAVPSFKDKAMNPNVEKHNVPEYCDITEKSTDTSKSFKGELFHVPTGLLEKDSEKLEKATKILDGEAQQIQTLLNAFQAGVTSDDVATRTAFAQEVQLTIENINVAISILDSMQSSLGGKRKEQIIRGQRMQADLDAWKV